MSVRFLQLRIFMHDAFAARGWIKRPAIPPADVQQSIFAIEVSADAMFLRSIAAKATMFPNAGKLLEFVSCDLMIGCVTCLAARVVHRLSAHLPPSRAKNSTRIFLLAPPEHLVEPVDAPISERAVAVVERIAPAAWMQFLVETTNPCRSGPPAPDQPIGRFFVCARSCRAAVGMREQADHPHFTDCAGAKKIHATDVVRTDAAVQADLNHA